MLRIAVCALALCACRSTLVRTPPAASATAAMPADAAAPNAAPTDAPICDPATATGFECDVIEGDLVHPEGIVD